MFNEDCHKWRLVAAIHCYYNVLHAGCEMVFELPQLIVTLSLRVMRRNSLDAIFITEEEMENDSCLHVVYSCLSEQPMDAINFLMWKLVGYS